MTATHHRLPTAATRLPDPATQAADEPTRYLASAVHFNDRLADLLVEEFLSEPLRSIPPSPGVRAGRVLREAVAARLRRRVFSLGLLVGMSIFAALAAPMMVIWLVSGLTWRVATKAVGLAWALLTKATGDPTEPITPAMRRWLRLAMWIFGMTAGLIFLLPLTALVVSATEDRTPAETEYLTTSAIATTVGALYFGLFAQTYWKWKLIDTEFRYGRFRHDAPSRGFGTIVGQAHAARLERITDHDEAHHHPPAHELVVYGDTDDPFVGAGTRVRSWSVALPLHSAESGQPTPTFRPAELHDHISRDLARLREAAHLTPGGRFTALEIAHWAVLAAQHLPHYPDARTLLHQLENYQNPQLTAQDWAQLIHRSPEWLRYYRCYRVQGWEQQLAVSTFLHIGCEQDTLYLEWNVHVLPPIARAYRHADHPPSMPTLASLWHALGELALLPTTVPERMIDLLRWLPEAAGLHHRRWRSPIEAEWLFGARASLRELGADHDLTRFFESADTDRYIKIIERRVFAAIHQFLSSRKIATADFDRMTTQINNSTILNNCDVIAGSIGGTRNIGYTDPSPDDRRPQQ